MRVVQALGQCGAHCIFRDGSKGFAMVPWWRDHGDSHESQRCDHLPEPGTTESHMYQLGKAVGSAAKSQMSLTNCGSKRIRNLQKSSKRWNLHQAVKDMCDLDNEEDAPASQSQKIPVSKHHLKKWRFVQKRHVEATKRTWLKTCDERWF